MKPNNFFDYGGTETVAGVLIFLLSSIIISSVAITWFLFQIYGVNISGVILPSQTDGSVNINLMDNSTASNANLYNSVGSTWTYDPLIGRTANNDNSYLVFDNIALGIGNYYTNDYWIKNPNKKDYSIVLEYNNDGVLEIITKQDGFYMCDSATLFGISKPCRYRAYPNANQITDLKITVKYSPTTTQDDGVVYSINDKVVFTIPWYESDARIGALDKIYYGGVGAKYAGLIITNFKTTNDKAENDLTNYTYLITAYIVAILKILVWNVDSMYLPLELNIMFIKTQLIGIGVCMVIILRG